MPGFVDDGAIGERLGFAEQRHARDLRGREDRKSLLVPLRKDRSPARRLDSLRRWIARPSFRVFTAPGMPGTSPTFTRAESARPRGSSRRAPRAWERFLPGGPFRSPVFRRRQIADHIGPAGARDSVSLWGGRASYHVAGTIGAMISAEAEVSREEQ